MPESNASDEGAGRRRSRRRATAQQVPPPQLAAADRAPSEQVANEPASEQARQREPKGHGRTAAPARGDRDLAGTVASQVGPTGAMRARDLNRPTAEDLARAEAELTIVRRNWNPAGEPAPQARRRRT